MTIDQPARPRISSLFWMNRRWKCDRWQIVKIQWSCWFSHSPCKELLILPQRVPLFWCFHINELCYETLEEIKVQYCLRLKLRVKLREYSFCSSKESNTSLSNITNCQIRNTCAISSLPITSFLFLPHTHLSNDQLSLYKVATLDIVPENYPRVDDMSAEFLWCRRFQLYGVLSQGRIYVSTLGKFERNS